MKKDAIFLLSRLAEFANEVDLDDHAVRIWIGHVEPAIARLRRAAFASVAQDIDPREEIERLQESVRNRTSLLDRQLARALAAAPHPAPDATDTQSRAMDIIERAAKRIEEIGDPLAAAQAENEKLRKLLARYRNETPLGHQPHMIAHEADKALALSPPPLSPEK